uniref:BAR domain-containing protein n=1 Tax=Romanomermis culicivorax TaxID=13658 RepID=A0A915IFX7_ROMCU
MQIFPYTVSKMFKKNLDRFKQTIAEKFGGDKTEYDAETTRILSRFDALKSHAQNLLSSVDVFYNLSNPTQQILLALASNVQTTVANHTSTEKTPSNEMEKLGLEMTNFVQKFGNKDPYGALLSNLGRMYTSLGKEQRACWKNAKDIACEPVRQFLRENFVLADQERKVLSDRRLDMDALKNKIRSSQKPAVEFKDELAVLEQAFNDQQMKTKEILTKLDSDFQEILINCVKHLTKSYQDHLAKCQQVLGDFEDK